MNSENLNIRKNLEANIPDYVFGRLNDEDKLFFENYMNDFPDIVAECKEAQAFFNKLENMDFDRVFAEHTKNVSVKVHNKLQNKRPTPMWARISRVAFPIVALVAIIFVNINTNKIHTPKAVNTKAIENTVNSSEALNLNTSVNNNISTDPFNTKESVDEFSEQIFKSAVAEHSTSKNVNEFYEDAENYQNSNNNSINTAIEKMSEQEFESIVEEISSGESRS